MSDIFLDGSFEFDDDSVSDHQGIIGSALLLYPDDDASSLDTTSFTFSVSIVSS
eukprot:CAMPEP_0194189082 /NCGR_PEP_ID=MMETSP0154-20130528/57489_1 /TAXON_ID=1049557 /ORGANISM="Thalassiothrix antarctica, Strain L6-D1" /LENGTH=53 /DNA_ID=CAMNT_0038910007 /DNA_START=388 /DNA_END=549 /DNA_ORIENTATION=-